jgi:myo-inositol-1(or 4)-monophosphatase
MPEEIAALLKIAKEAAALGAAVHQSALRSSKVSFSTKHSAFDLVTEVDREAERQIVSAIHKARPHDSIIGEEGANVDGRSAVAWIIDPLDGTTNFVHRYPSHSVAIGVEINEVRVLGVVHDTYQNQVFAGGAGVRATCEDQLIRVGEQNDLSKALTGTGFLPDARVRRIQAEILKHVLPHVRDIRRSGCPSIDICRVASGALDIFYESGLGRWDIAAGAAIAEAAGATVLMLTSTVLPNPLLVVGNAKLVAALTSLLAAAGIVNASAD